MAYFTHSIEELDASFAKVAANIIKYYDNEKERKNVLKEVRDIVKQNCLITGQIKATNEIKEQLTPLDDLNTSQNTTLIRKKYKQLISAIEVNPLEDERLLAYDRQIEELLQISQQSPDKADDSSADLRLTGSEINVIDPISKTRMTDPVKNTICGHVYDKESLTAMLKKNNKTRCPVVGCANKEFIVLSQCRPDVVTKTFLEKHPA